MAPERSQRERRGTAEAGGLAARRGVEIVCPSFIPRECSNGLCCAQDSVCAPGDSTFGGCVFSSLGQTITLLALPKTASIDLFESPTFASSAGVPSSTSAASQTEGPSGASPTPTNPSSETTNTLLTSLPTATSEASASTSTISGSIIGGSPTGTASLSDSTLMPTLPTGTENAGALPTEAAEGSLSEAAQNLGANLGQTQKAALIATPIGSIVVALLVYLFWWRRRKQPATTERSIEATPLHERSPMPPMEFGGDNEQLRARHSLGPTSLAPTPVMGIFPRAGRDHGPLRSHPITIPESAFQSDSHRGSTQSDTALVPPVPDYSQDGMRRSSNSMRRITTWLEQSQQAGPSDPAEIPGPRLHPPENDRSWKFTRWSRRQGSDIYFVPRSPTRPESDWITPVDWGNDGPRPRQESWQTETTTADPPPHAQS